MTTEFFLLNNFFMFDREYYLQVEGAPIGAKFSNFLAKIFMIQREKSFIFSENNPYFSSIKWYGRFIDDLLGIWKDTEEVFEGFVDYLNMNNMNLRFTYTFGGKRIDFLDVTICGQDKEIIVSTMIKKLDLQTSAKNGLITKNIYLKI